MELKPVTKIEGLFNSYEDEQVVPAKEYNANITALKAAIEHNGSVMKEQQQTMDALVVDKLPVGGVTDEYLADGAVTLDKLDPQTKAQMLLSPENISAFFGDFLIQHHKSKPDMQGSFMNGTIRSVNTLLSKQMTYTRTVTHGAGGAYDYDSDDNQIPINAPNLAAPETYTIKTDCGAVWGFHYSWQTRYVLDEAYDINPTTDTFVLNWTFVYQEYSNPNSGSGQVTVYFKNAAGETVFQTQHTNSDTSRNNNNSHWYRTYTVNLKDATTSILHGIKEVVIDTGMHFAGASKKRNPNNDPYTPTFEINFSFSNGTSETCLHNITVPSAGSVNYAVLAAYVKPAVTTDFDAYPLNIAPYCIGQCPYQPAPGLPESVFNYINRTEDSKYSVELTNSSTKQYFIRHEFQTPVIVSACISADKPANVHPEFIAGEYYSWPLSPVDNSYISYAKVNDVISAISDLLEGHIEDVSVTEYVFGDNQIAIQFNTTVNNVTVESMSIAQYPGFSKPTIGAEATTFNLRRLR